MLSKRLMTIAKMVPPGARIADIGCDHGFLDIYLTINNDNLCTAIDKSKACILKTSENIKIYNLENKIKVIHNDGLNKLNTNDFDLVILAGLGVKTFFNVLKETNINRVIAQINDDMFKLRKKISELGYIINNEEVVCERGKYYIIMCLEKGNINYKYSDYLLGPILRHKKEIDVKKYYLDILSVYESALVNIPIRDIFKKLSYQKKVVTIKRMLEHFD